MLEIFASHEGGNLQGNMKGQQNQTITFQGWKERENHWEGHLGLLVFQGKFPGGID